MTLAVVVLAAGASRRLGEPKALARIGERTALQHLLEASRHVAAGRALVVTGAHHDSIARHVNELGLDADVVRNARWAEGRTGSVACAAGARACDDLLVCPVDVPLVTSAVLQALADAWAEAGAPGGGWLAPWVAAPRVAPSRDDSPAEPHVRRRFGHPIVLGRELARSAGGALPDSPLRSLRENARPLLAVETDDLCVLDDLDTPADLRRLRERVSGT